MSARSLPWNAVAGIAPPLSAEPYLLPPPSWVDRSADEDATGSAASGWLSRFPWLAVRAIFLATCAPPAKACWASPPSRSVPARPLVSGGGDSSRFAVP